MATPKRPLSTSDVSRLYSIAVAQHVGAKNTAKTMANRMPEGVAKRAALILAGSPDRERDPVVSKIVEDMRRSAIAIRERAANNAAATRARRATAGRQRAPVTA
jgi:hypothetical protein